ncbi:hypothetical protein QE152_g33637 [Popillia japonica]|uniref:Uncharacterized protein n=1 Tax=Popillia japonica TaxID=7064 RepID=A0AAW1IVY6_POPJA
MCKKQGRTEEPAVCCNCGRNHPASSVECPAYIAAVEAKNKRNLQATLSTQVNKKRFLPAPPPKRNAWMRNEFPPLNQTVAVVGDEPIRNSGIEPRIQRTSPDSEERVDENKRVNGDKGGGPTWLRVDENKRVNGEYEATEMRGRPSSSAMNDADFPSSSAMNDADFSSINRIASSFNAINEIVNLEWLADRVEELYTKIKKCSTLLEYARVIKHLRRNNNGGVAVLVREDVPYKRLPLRDPALQSMEAVAIQLQDDTIVIACYNSPRMKLTELELNALFAMGGIYIDKHLTFRNAIENNGRKAMAIQRYRYLFIHRQLTRDFYINTLNYFYRLCSKNLVLWRLQSLHLGNRVSSFPSQIHLLVDLSIYHIHY